MDLATCSPWLPWRRLPRAVVLTWLVVALTLWLQCPLRCMWGARRRAPGVSQLRSANLYYSVLRGVTSRGVCGSVPVAVCC